MSDKITVLETLGPNLTKVYASDGSTVPYEDAASFKVKEVEVAGLKEIRDLLGKMHKQPKRCLIRGKFVGPERGQPGNKPGTWARNNANFDDQPLHWFMVDIDGFRPDWVDPVTDTELAVQEFIEAVLPPAFKSCSFYWHLSSSAGMPGKEGILKCHVHLWSKTAYTTAQMNAWAKVIGPAIDSAVYRRVQVHYTADPIFEEGRIDPVAVRAGWHQGETDYVDLVIDQSVLDQAREQGAGNGGEDMKLVDPSEKEGLLGLFHRVFSAEDVLLTLLEGEFEQVTERRYTWHNGGGTPEGVWVHNDGNHVGSSHNTWPIDGIANLWDLVRVFKFGELDAPAGVDDFEKLDIATLPVGQRPSDKAMYAWAEQLPELQQALVEELDAAYLEHRALITGAAHHQLLSTVIARGIKEDQRLTRDDRNRLADAYQARYRELTGTRLPIADVRSLLAPPRNLLMGDAPQWVQDWAWVVELDCFINVATKQQASVQSFGAMFDRYMAPFADSNGIIPKAATMALNTWGVPVYDAVQYNPVAGLEIGCDGLRFLNTYRPDLLPETPASYSKADLRAIKALERHLRLLVPADKEREILTSWMAHCVQHPGRKIRWSPLIIGMQGDGKSALTELMGYVLGAKNVRILNNKTLESNFTGWSVGQCFIGVEELKMHGHSRYDIYNSLKPIISNSSIEVHPKGRDPYNVPNFSNIMALSNFLDAAPVDDGDRRWFFVKTPLAGKTEADLRAYIQREGGVSDEQHFHELFDLALKNHHGALRKWLLEYPIPEWFNPNGRAPDTNMRDVAIALSASDVELAVQSAIAEGGLGIYENLISTKHLTTTVLETSGQRITGQTVSSILSRLGWTIYGKDPVHWRGQGLCRWYYRGERPTHPGQLAVLLEEQRLNKEVSREFED